MQKRRVRRSWLRRLLVPVAVLAAIVWPIPQAGPDPVSAVTVAAPHLALPFNLPTSWFAVRQAPPPSVSRPAPSPTRIAVRLFAARRIDAVRIEAPEGLMLKGVALPGRLFLYHRGERVLARGPLAVSSERRFVLTPVGGKVILRPERGRALTTTGELRISVVKGQLQIVNAIDLEDYVLGIIQPELGSLNLPPEAIRAQLIAARSYVLAVHDRHPHQDYAFCDTAHCQMYTGLIMFPERFRQIARATRGLYLSYHGRPAAAFFHHSCGGMTAAVEDVWPGGRVAYLRNVKDDPAEILDRRGLEWRFTLPKHALEVFLVKHRWLPARETLEDLAVIRRDKSGRASQILVRGNGQKWIKAGVFRQAMNSYFRQEILPSLMFRTENVRTEIQFIGKGWGHGVGLCQAGTVRLARKGASAEAILSHYYPGTELTRIDDVLPPGRPFSARIVDWLRSTLPNHPKPK